MEDEIWVMYTMGYTTFTAIQLPNPDSIVAEQSFDYPPHQILDENQFLQMEKRR